MCKMLLFQEKERQKRQQQEQDVRRSERITARMLEKMEQVRITDNSPSRHFSVHCFSHIGQISVRSIAVRIKQRIVRPFKLCPLVHISLTKKCLNEDFSRSQQVHMDEKG